MAVWGIARGIDPWYMVIGVVVLVAACASLFTHVASWRKPKPQSSVYLDSLRPSVCQRLDRPDTQRWIGGERLAHALNAHPVEGSPGRFWSSYEFRLPEGCHHLCGAAAIADRDEQGTQNQRSNTPLVFEISGDDKLLWKSRPLQRAGDLQFFQVDLSAGCERLQLQVNCPGHHGSAWAVWISPLLCR